MLSGHAFDVASSNRHVVKPWFSGKTAIAPPVVDLGDAGFPLLGGRLDVPLRAPMPALVYRAGPHVISVFMRPAEGESAPHLTKIDGFSVLALETAGFRLLRGVGRGLRRGHELPESLRREAEFGPLTAPARPVGASCVEIIETKFPLSGNRSEMSPP